jgi:CBS domain containing-hemolysin-like protein
MDDPSSSLLILASFTTESHLPREWESIGSVIWNFAVILFFVFLNGFFVASEFAIVKVRSSQLDTEIGEGTKGARFAKKVTHQLDAYLSATQLGITLASLALGFLGEPYVARVLSPLLFKIWPNFPEHWIGNISLAIAFAITTFLHIVLGELTPKSLAIRKSLPVTLAISRPLHFFYVLFKPAIYVLNGTANWLLKVLFKTDPICEHELVHTADELRVIMAEAGTGIGTDEMTDTEKDIALNALDLNDLVIRDIMTPRNEVISLDLGKDFAHNLATAKNSQHTRFPLVKHQLDDSIGLIHIKDVLGLVGEKDPDLRSILRELHAVPEMMPLDKLLQFLRQRRAHLALAVDEFGGAVGIVTLEDVIEELVGEIQDEFDDEKAEFRKVSEDEFVVAGSLNLYDFNELSGLNLESDDVSTIGGFITGVIGHLPQAEESVRVDDYEATTTKTDGRRILQLRFKRRSSLPVDEVAEEE